MKIMVASDIHGSAKYCRKMLDAYRAEQAERLLLLGDILYHGPRNELPEEYAPKRVAELLNAVKNEILCVRGNCDAEVDQMLLEFPVMAEYCILYVGGRMIFASHGHVFNEDRLPPLSDGDILLGGHTHIPCFHEHGEYLYMNPGSVSIPKGSSERGYMIIEDGYFCRKTLDGIVCESYTAIGDGKL